MVMDSGGGCFLPTKGALSAQTWCIIALRERTAHAHVAAFG